MPKMKTHSGSAKRFKVTGSGRITRRQANRNHLLEHKPTKRTRRLDGRIVLDPADEITAGVLVTHDGEVVHPAVRALLNGET